MQDKLAMYPLATNGIPPRPEQIPLPSASPQPVLLNGGRSPFSSSSRPVAARSPLVPSSRPVRLAVCQAAPSSRDV